MNMLRASGDWDLIRSLGEGGFGEVHHWKHRITNQEIATKSLKPNAKLKPDEIAIFKKRWMQEYNWMQSLKTPYIVGAVNLGDKTFLNYLQENNHWKTLPVIVMEYCNGGDLRSRLERPEHLNGLREQEIRDILRTLRHAVEYLHVQCNIEHRDIKPENIVIHQSENGKMYKLTDFGYARDIPEHTIAQSVVGTRHYVAPEVIEPGSYTKSVDYWSVAVMVFELICGIRPFIPHKQFQIMMTQVLAKPKYCIAITQNIDASQEGCDSFIFEEKIFEQNMCSPIFIEKTERWLKLALDSDYKTRGCLGDTFRFYSDMDSILATDIISVFSLSSYQFLYFEVNAFQNVGEFFAKLSQESKIEQKNMHLTLPTSHPKILLSNIKKPSDFFVADWTDNHNPDNPFVMLYVTDVTKEQCDCNVHQRQTQKQISETILKCLGIDKKRYDKVPIWLLEQFERHVHSILSKEQRHLECYLKGLYEFIITIEDEVFRYEDNIKRLYEDTLILCGRVKQFARTQNSQIWLSKANSYKEKCQLLKDNVITTITTRHKSILRHCKQLADKDIFKSLPKLDFFNVDKFRQFVVESRNLHYTNSKRMSHCMEAFDDWANKKYPPVDLHEIHRDIVLQYEIFRKIQDNIECSRKYIMDLERDLDKDTEQLLGSTSLNDQLLLLKMGTLRIDGNLQSTMSLSASTSISLTNGDCYANGDNGVTRLIEENNILMNLIKSELDIEDDNLMCIDDNLPTTINEI